MIEKPLKIFELFKFIHTLDFIEYLARVPRGYPIPIPTAFANTTSPHSQFFLVNSLNRFFFFFFEII